MIGVSVMSDRAMSISLKRPIRAIYIEYIPVSLASENIAKLVIHLK